MPTFTELPAGVRVVKVYRAGYCLLECEHAAETQIVSAGGLFCTVCRSDDLRRTVKLIAHVPEGAREPKQELLF